jgi:membrane-bound serine protease (ClpP class)
MWRPHVQAFWLIAALLAGLASPARTAPAEPPPLAPAAKRVFVVPIRDDIMPPLVYLVRRGVKQAMDAGADLLVLDMETNGGRVDSTEKIIEIISQFKGKTVTFVNRNAYSAGAFISVATERIYMAPQGVIGAAAPIMLSPGGGGVEQMPDTMEIKMTSAISAKIRAQAQKNGHNSDVVEAMIDKQKELILDGQTINPKGKILTLTNLEAEKTYGNPPKPLLSAGTVENLKTLLDKLDFSGAQITTITPTGAEKIASWINALNWLWLMIGIAGIYIEFKTPGFGLPGIVGLCAFALYFLGSYVAGLAGWEWPALFVVGLILVVLELFVFPGVVVLGLAGAGLMLITLIMAMVDLYPGMPAIPTLPQLSLPLRDLTYAFLGTVVLLLLLGRFLPKTTVYHALVSHSASGMESVQTQASTQANQVGREGVALSVLRPGGKAQFGDTILDVMTQGELLPKGARVRIIAHSGREAVVEELPQPLSNAPQHPA